MPIWLNECIIKICFDAYNVNQVMIFVFQFNEIISRHGTHTRTHAQISSANEGCFVDFVVLSKQYHWIGTRNRIKTILVANGNCVTFDIVVFFFTLTVSKRLCHCSNHTALNWDDSDKWPVHLYHWDVKEVMFSEHNFAYGWRTSWRTKHTPEFCWSKFSSCLTHRLRTSVSKKHAFFYVSVIHLVFHFVFWFSFYSMLLCLVIVCAHTVWNAQTVCISLYCYTVCFTVLCVSQHILFLYFINFSFLFFPYFSFQSIPLCSSQFIFVRSPFIVLLIPFLQKNSIEFWHK